MPSSIDRRRSAAPTPRAAGSLRIDRVACTGHGICAALLPDGIELDEWGYRCSWRAGPTRSSPMRR